ncbi:MAG: TonB-dependent receptor [Paracoccus sp.]|nr:TonB-dependent receptor [Paracoccus sp. (in: a-proteobacteria)]
MKRLAILAAIAAAPPALGQQTPYVLPEITLTANREQTEIGRSGSSVSVIGAVALADRTAQPIADSIAELPGVAIRQSGPLGTTGALQVRGAPPEYTPVLIDGIDVSDPAAGQPYFDIGGLITAGVGRIELLRGTQSALYGSRAIAGVLSIDTLRPTEDGLRQNFAIEAGQYQTFAASYGAALRRDGTDLAFTASRVTSQGFSARDENDGNFETDSYNASRLSFYAARELQNGGKVGINGFWDKSRAEFDEFGGDMTGTPGDEYTTRKSYGLRAFAEVTTGSIDQSLALTRYRIDRRSWSNGVETPFIGSRTKVSWQGATDLGTTGARAILGADTEKEKADGMGDSRISGVFAEVDAPIGSDIDLSASLRRDDHSRFGGFTSGRVSAVWRARPDLLVRAAIGTGFRAPSLYELFGPYGDAGLDREESRTAEIGVEKRWGDDSYLRATAFWLQAENLIGFDADATACGQLFGCYAQVQGQSRRRGIELDGRWAIGAATAIRGSYTYTDNAATTDWAEAPRHVLNLGAETEFAAGTRAGMSLHVEADRPRDMASFATLDLTASHPLPNGADVYLRVENVLDREYQQNQGYGTSDRAVYVGLRADF